MLMFIYCGITSYFLRIVTCYDTLLQPIFQACLTSCFELFYRSIAFFLTIVICYGNDFMLLIFKRV